MKVYRVSRQGRIRVRVWLWKLYQETMRDGFESDADMDAARLALAQSMRDRSSRDQEEAARALKQTAAELRAMGSPCALDTANTMELAATLRRSSD